MRKNILTIDTISVDRNTLFGELDDVIDYLLKIKKQYKNGESIYLNEEWSGYEDNYFEIVVTRMETDDECLKREEKEEQELQREKLREKRRLEVAECKRKREIEKQIEDLKKQL